MNVILRPLASVFYILKVACRVVLAPILGLIGRLLAAVFHKQYYQFFDQNKGIKETFNHTKYVAETKDGHYESFFQRANHPSRPLAFWIRYTIFKPANRPQDAIGELWAIWFDGERRAHVPAKQEFKIADCSFDTKGFGASLGSTASLQHGVLRGSIIMKTNTLNGDSSTDNSPAENVTISWDLTYSCQSSPMWNFPLRFYNLGLPKAKVLVGSPLASYDGKITVHGEQHDIANWIGSQNHNWGVKHTDSYAWGQVAGFDGVPNTFFEVATARLKFGPIWTPNITILTLRYEGEEFVFNYPHQWFSGAAQFAPFDWTFEKENSEVLIKGHIYGNSQDFVGLKYYNPPGGIKVCLNSKLAACDLDVTFKKKAPQRTVQLHTKHRAAFEILTDDVKEHGIKLSV